VPEDIVIVEVDGPVATVTLNRPDARNALDRELRRALPTTLRALDERDDVLAVVLTGADPAFCAGLDLKELAAGGNALRETGADGGGSGRRGPFPDMATPVIGAINGVAITGGFELALNCDFLIASEHAKFGDTHSRVGVMPGWGLTVLLPQAIGVRRAKEMSLTGNFMDAAEALSFGLVNRVVPHDELLATTRAVAVDIAGNDQVAVRALLDEYKRTSATTVGEGLQIEAELARGWQGRSFDPAEVERRRQAIVERGRSQV
jgi:enoyl-CoA hydratase